MIEPTHYVERYSRAVTGYTATPAIGREDRIEVSGDGTFGLKDADPRNASEVWNPLYNESQSQQLEKLLMLDVSFFEDDEGEPGISVFQSDNQVGIIISCSANEVNSLIQFGAKLPLRKTATHGVSGSNSETPIPAAEFSAAKTNRTFKARRQLSMIL